jgi:hypothetical protein
MRNAFRSVSIRTRLILGLADPRLNLISAVFGYYSINNLNQFSDHLRGQPDPGTEPEAQRSSAAARAKPTFCQAGARWALLQPPRNMDR